MYCNTCGKSNPDGSAFCTSCGKPLSPTFAQQPTPTRPVRPVEPPVSAQDSGPELMDFRSHFRSSWREFAATPLALALIICHSVSVLLGMIELAAMMDSLGMVYDVMRLMGLSGGGAEEKFWLNLILIMLVAPGVLIAVGLWKLYVDARGESDRLINVNGLKLIKGVHITQMALSCLSVIFYYSTAQELTGSGYLVEELQKEMILFAIVEGLVIAYLWIVIKFIGLVQDCAELCEPNTKYAKGLAVVEFICGGVAVLGMLSMELTLITVVNAAMLLLSGVVLLKYKDLMETLLWDQKQYDAQYEATRTLNRSRTQNEQSAVQHQPIPTWKRVEMERENSKQ